jgi:outer membrane murein-binding lipoprotein Lpp
VYEANREEIAMKRFSHTILALIFALVFLTGCSSMPKIPVPKIPGVSKESADDELYRKVPASMRADVKEAQYDLKRAKSNVAKADEQLKLAELKKEREILKNKYARYNKDLAEVLVKKADIGVEIKKLEAVNNANLGDKADIIKQIAHMKTKQLSIESDEIEIKADMDTTHLRIKQLSKQIDAQEKIARK